MVDNVVFVNVVLVVVMLLVMWFILLRVLLLCEKRKDFVHSLIDKVGSKVEI